MHSLVRVAPFILAILAAVPGFASISPTIDVQVVSTNEATEDILMWVDLHEVGGDCPLAGATPCMRTRIALTVTPAPVGLPATNGSYSITYFAEATPTRSFTLNRGQQYRFATHTTYTVGRPAAGGTCNGQCIYEHDGVANYTATPLPPPPTAPTWDVVQDHIEGNLMWVNVRILNPKLDGPCSGGSAPCIGEHYVYVTITPCPAEASWGDGCSSAYYTPVQTVFQVALEFGKTYTISGVHHTFGLTAELHGGCVPSGCTHNEPAVDKVITASPVATQPITWGAVKSMYRQ